MECFSWQGGREGAGAENGGNKQYYAEMKSVVWIVLDSWRTRASSLLTRIAAESNAHSCMLESFLYVKKSVEVSCVACITRIEQ